MINETISPSGGWFNHKIIMASMKQILQINATLDKSRNVDISLFWQVNTE
jgi:hypothetical protein